MGKYFNVTVKPPVAVAALAAGNILDTEILFDWHGFDIPKGAARLIGASVELRPKGNGNADPNTFALELMLAKSKTRSKSVKAMLPSRFTSGLISCVK